MSFYQINSYVQKMTQQCNGEKCYSARICRSQVDLYGIHLSFFVNNSQSFRSEDLTKAEGLDVELVIFIVLASVLCMFTAAMAIIVIIWRKRSG